MDMTKVANFILYIIENKATQITDKKVSILLFLIDFQSLQENGEKIFSDEYIKESRHPMPKKLSEIFKIIANNEDVDEDDENLFLIQELLDFVDIEVIDKQKFIELQFLKYEEEFNASLFSKEEMKIIDNILKEYKETSVRNIANACFKIDKVRETQNGEVII